MATLSFLKRTQTLPISVEEAWKFFTDPQNLQKITPPEMNFRILSEFELPGIYPGQIIQYKVSPLWGITFSWVTEITHVRSKEYFVDEQRTGPYQFWHHAHFFRPVSGGVEMIDLVHYRAPGWILSKGLDRWLVRNKLVEIFDFRARVLKQIFPG